MNGKVEQKRNLCLVLNVNDTTGKRKNMETKFKRSTTLDQALDELDHGECKEITRIMDRDGVFTIEWN